MIKQIICIAIWLLSFSFAGAQQLICKQVRVSFYSDATLEKIEAHTSSGLSVWDTAQNKLAFSILMKGFEFKKALMQKHFNENYVESDKYPKARFTGSIVNVRAIRWNSPGNYTVQVSGDLTVHGITRQITVPATIGIQKGKVWAEAKFTISLADYGIEIPALVKNNISKQVEIKVFIPAFEKR